MVFTAHPLKVRTCVLVLKRGRGRGHFVVIKSRSCRVEVTNLIFNLHSLSLLNMQSGLVGYDILFIYCIYFSFSIHRLTFQPLSIFGPCFTLCLLYFLLTLGMNLSSHLLASVYPGGTRQRKGVCRVIWQEATCNGLIYILIPLFSPVSLYFYFCLLFECSVLLTLLTWIKD